ncbi:MIT domain-containing protein 1 [Schistosoma japonicum]|nr:MIT domain-containing protein 1 [Schistosoma japonicum]
MFPLSENMNSSYLSSIKFTMTSNSLIEAGSIVMVRAIELEKQLKFTESLTCYEESIGLFIKALRSIPQNTQLEFKEKLRQKVSEYITHAEKLKEKLKKESENGNYHEQIVIDEGATGFSYKRVFGRFLEDGTASKIWVDDPYIRNSYQIENFSHFCEVVVQSESDVKNIYLTTGEDTQQKSVFVMCLYAVDHRIMYYTIYFGLDSRITEPFICVRTHPYEQIEKFGHLKDDLEKHNIHFEWTFSDTLHDREIRFDNGWIVKIGRGLDYFRRPEHKFCGLGVHDYEFRSCSATTIDIFHSSILR